MDIHDWWNRTRKKSGALKLSSRRIIVFLSQQTDESCFKIAWNDNWPEARNIQAAILNELRIMRSENVVLAGGEYREPQVLKNPQQVRADELGEEQRLAIRNDIMRQLTKNISTE